MGSIVGPVYESLPDFFKRAQNGRSILMDGNMRRLPPWMLAGASSGVTDTSKRKDDTSVEGKRKHESPKSKAEKRPRRSVKLDESEEPKKVEIRGRRRERVGRKIIEEEEVKPSIGGDGKTPEIIQSMTCPEDEDLTIDDLLSFAQEYVKGEEDQTRNERGSLSTSKLLVDVDESNRTSSQGNRSRDPTSEDMINLLLGPFFKKSQ